MQGTPTLRCQPAHGQQRMRDPASADEGFHALYHSVAYGVLVASAAGQILDANAAAEDVLGYSLDQMRGRAASDLWQGVREDGAELPAADYPDRTAARTCKPVRNCVLSIARPDGTRRWLQVDAVPLLGPDREPVQVVSTFVDVTERKQLEEQLRLSQRLEAIGRLAGGVAHDFNNLLTIILGSTELLSAQLDSADPRGRYVSEITSAGERAASLTRQLLAFGRRQVLAPEVLDLNAVVVDLDDMLRRLLGPRVELRAVLDPVLGRVKADSGQIEQVILNLVVNARDAMPNGGKLTIETANVDLDDAYARRRMPVQPGPYVRIAVTDTGTGMDAETQAHVFEPFFTTKDLGKGTGLGLSTVYGIVKQSGGYVWVYSELGLGTTFKVYLPRVEAAVPTPRLQPVPGASLHGTETVLVVEDQAELGAIVRDVLQQHGYTVLEANRAGQALQVSDQHPGPIHLLLTDVVMPEMGGRDLANRLAPRRPSMQVLYMSGYTDQSITSNGFLEAGLAFLEKPFTSTVLLQKVRNLLDAPLNPLFTYSGRELQSGALQTRGTLVADPAGSALAPQTWCSRILTTLNRRRADSPSARSLKMLLTYLVELNPAAEALADQLAQSASDPRPNIAETARVLQEAWLQASVDAAVAPPPSLQGTLRTLGALLDEPDARGAYLVLAPNWVQLHTFGAHSTLQLGPLQLRQEIAARAALRGMLPPADPALPDRYETRLRAVGAELDRQPLQAYELVLTPRTVDVESTTGYSRLFTTADLATLLRESAAHRPTPH
jgi:PAS domain S-box-containing protein